MTKFSSRYLKPLLLSLSVAACCSFGVVNGQEPSKTEAELLEALNVLESQKKQEVIVPVPGRTGVVAGNPTVVESTGPTQAAQAAGPTGTSGLQILPALPEASEATDATLAKADLDSAPKPAEFAEAAAGTKAAKGYETAAAGYPAEGKGGKEKPKLIDPDLPMFLLFLLITLAAFFILSKYVWKPILATLDEREEKIQASLDNAEKVEIELAQIETTRSETIAAADAKAKVIIEEARKGGSELQRVMEEEGKENARILRENAEREIGAATEKAQSQLRTDSAELAVQLASQILGKELDGDRAKSYTDELIQKL